ncbi:hypothetical protein DFH06DRAFT_254195 [Mycena polygramma]|nr:hypothetical protein DFH06DRAFT_254195 [Mycena polygramma]
MATFPGEIVDSIIDQLKTDKSALQACSLVSQQWVPRSRLHLFAAISLFINWGKDLEGPARVNQFLFLVTSPLVTFIPFVKKIHLRHDRGFLQPRVMLRGGPEEDAVISPDRILAALSAGGIRPSHFFLHCPLFFMRPFTAPPEFASSLVFLGVDLTDDRVILGSVIDYICSFPLLQSLEVTASGNLKEITPTRPQSLSLPLHLNRMYIGHPLVADWVLTLEPLLKQFKTLDLFHFTSQFSCKWTGINKFLESTAVENTESLTFTQCELDDDAGPSLQRFRHLRHLVINGTHTFAPRSLLGVLKRLRGSTAATTLETITVSLDFVTTCHYPAYSWLALDKILGDAHAWPCLRNITLTTDDHDSVQEDDFFPWYRSDNNIDSDLRYFLGVLAYDAELEFPIAVALREHLPECDKRGILCIENIPFVDPTHSSG